jgi:hypothetical protein
VLSNDIVGGDNTRQQQGLVRIFSEGLPAAASEGETRKLRMLGAESDSPSRQLARYLASDVAAYLPVESVQPKLIFRQDRFLRGGDHTSFNELGYSAVRITEFQENYDHQHQIPRRENGIEYGDSLECGSGWAPGFRTCAPVGGEIANKGAGELQHAALDGVSGWSRDRVRSVIPRDNLPDMGAGGSGRREPTDHGISIEG